MNVVKEVWKFDHRNVVRLKAMPHVTKAVTEPNIFRKNGSKLHLFAAICSRTKLMSAALLRLRSRSPLEETAMPRGKLSANLAGASPALLMSGSYPNYLPYCL